MPKFLLVEDSPIVVKIIKHLTKDTPELTCDVASNRAEAEALIEKNLDQYYAALVDLNLPDAPDGEVVDHCISKALPTIVLTGNFDEEKRIEIQKKRVVDYIVKESRFSYEYAVKLLMRLHKNKDISILVVDDSSTSRKHIANLLKSQLYKVETADDGDTALEMLASKPEIKMVITDFNMPRMNGFELVKEVRKQVDKNDLIIIGLSADGDHALSAKFIKNGANDFLKKPFSHEEFNCRVMHNIENMEFTQTMRQLAFQDYASTMPNKRFFFEEGEAAVIKARKEKRECQLAILSIDKLDKLQDEYGIDTPDLIMRELAGALTSAFSRFKYARLNDGEVGVILSGIQLEQAERLMNGLIEKIEDHIMLINGQSVQTTLSVGLTTISKETLLQNYREADNLLYSARKNGGNQLAM